MANSAKVIVPVGENPAARVAFAEIAVPVTTSVSSAATVTVGVAVVTVTVWQSDAALLFASPAKEAFQEKAPALVDVTSVALIVPFTMVWPSGPAIGDPAHVVPACRVKTSWVAPVYPTPPDTAADALTSPPTAAPVVVTVMVGVAFDTVTDLQSDAALLFASPRKVAFQ